MAVVVGIDRYGGTPRWDLAGPVDDAVRFVRWFLSVGVPAGRITLLATPVPSAPDGVEVLPADRVNVREVLVRRAARLEHRTLFVVWGGHGFVDLQRRRRLYYADTDLDDPLDLDLDSLLARYASTRVPHLHRQFWIVDACQVDSPPSANHETFEAGEPVAGRTQDVLFAAGFGQRAIDLPVERTGIFSREVLRVLEADGLPALTTPGHLASRLGGVFTDLRSRGRTAQTPTYLWYRSPTGDEGHLLRPPAGPAPSAERPLGPTALKPAVDALESIPEFRRPNDREVILGLLRGPIYTAIPRSPVTRIEAVNVIRTCLRYPGGLTELIEAVRFFAGEDPAMDRFERAARPLDPQA